MDHKAFWMEGGELADVDERGYKVEPVEKD